MSARSLALTYSAHLVKWITENNRPVNIINDRELRDLLMAGRPSIQLPSNYTISRDINASFEKCQERVAKLLQEHPGCVHFATDAWTSPNHRMFVAWTLHLEFEGEMLAFLLDVVKLPEVNSFYYYQLLLLTLVVSLIQVSRWRTHSKICSSNSN